MLAAGEDVDLVGHDYVGEADQPRVLSPLCFQQSTSNSTAPEVDVVLRLLRDLLVDQDVADLDAAARLEDAIYLAEDSLLVGAEIDHPVADQDVGRLIIDRQALSVARPEL